MLTFKFHGEKKEKKAYESMHTIMQMLVALGHQTKQCMLLLAKISSQKN